MMKINKKIAAACSVVALAGAVFIGTTLAWLSDTETVTNQFAVGKVAITLTEDKWVDGSKLIPGVEIAKDPVVTVTGGSEDCYVFASYSIPADLDGVLTVGEINNNWQLVPNTNNIYQYIGTQAANNIIKSSSNDVPLEALFGSVTVSEDWNGKDANGNYLVDLLSDDSTTNDPNLTVPVRAYAVQADYLTEGNDPAANEAKAIDMAKAYFSAQS